MGAEGTKIDAGDAADVGAAFGGIAGQVAAVQGNQIAAYSNCVNTFTDTDKCKPTAAQKKTVIADVTASVNADAAEANKEIEDAANEAAAVMACVAKCKPDDADCALGCASNAPVAGMSILAGALAAAAYMV